MTLSTPDQNRHRTVKPFPNLQAEEPAAPPVKKHKIYVFHRDDPDCELATMTYNPRLKKWEFWHENRIVYHAIYGPFVFLWAKRNGWKPDEMFADEFARHTRGH